MKIAIDSGLTKGGSGYGMGTYVRELTGHLRGVDIVDFSKTNLKKYDVVHFTRFRPFSVSLPFFKPRGVKFVLTIYDLIPLIYPKHYPPGIKGWVKWQINKFLIIKNVDAIITISETSKKDICRFLGINPEKVFVTYLAAPEEYKYIPDKENILFIRKKYKLPEDFVLCDADVYYSKNIPNLVKACRLIKTPLVLVGAGEKTIRFAEEHSFNHPELRHLKNVDWKDVTLLSAIDIHDLVKIYNLAKVYVQPSFYEGFGIPLLQAFICKVPAIAARTQALVEIGEAACVFADPDNPKDIADKIELVLRNPELRSQLINTGSEVIQGFSWVKTAKETMEVYKKV